MRASLERRVPGDRPPSPEDERRRGGPADPGGTAAFPGRTASAGHDVVGTVAVRSPRSFRERRPRGVRGPLPGPAGARSAAAAPVSSSFGSVGSGVFWLSLCGVCAARGASSTQEAA